MSDLKLKYQQWLAALDNAELTHLANAVRSSGYLSAVA